MAHSILLWLEAQSYWVQILVGSYVSRRGCAYTVLQTVQSMGCAVMSMALCTIKKPLYSVLFPFHSLLNFQPRIVIR